MYVEPILFVYSNNKKCGSKVISWVTRQPGQKVSDVPSHFSIVIYEWIVIESTLAYGVKPKLFSKFKDQNKIVAMFAPRENKKDFSRIAKKNADRIRNAKYDFAGVLYLGIYELLNYYFRTPIPKTNKFQSNEDYFCNEIYAEMYGGDVSMKHPNSLLQEMRKDETLIQTV